MLPMLHTIKKQHRRQKMNLSMAVIISHHTVYFPKRKTVILNISRESSAQIQNLVFFVADNIAGRTRKYRYNYKAFYAAAGNSTFDIFKCSENGKLYVPGAFELFGYTESI